MASATSHTISQQRDQDDSHAHVHTQLLETPSRQQQIATAIKNNARGQNNETHFICNVF